MSDKQQIDDQDKMLILREWAVAVTDALQALAAGVTKDNALHHAHNVESAYERLREVLNSEVKT